MSESIKPRSMIFTLYGDYIQYYGGEIWIGSLLRLLEEFGHSGQSVRAAISRMNKQGWVQSRKEGNKSFYSLTPRGSRRVKEAAKRIYKLQNEVWDGKWRMLIYSIPEDKRNIRDELRKELGWSGFGFLSNSCWVSPNDLKEQVYDMFERYDISQYVDFFVTTYDGPKENKDLVQKCWNLSEINERFQQFIDAYLPRYELSKAKIEQGEMEDGACFVERTQLVHVYRKFLFYDPGLPDELLPDFWLGDRAAALFRHYYEALALPASRFFESIFEEGNELNKRNEGYNEKDHPFIVKVK